MSLKSSHWDTFFNYTFPNADMTEEEEQPVSNTYEFYNERTEEFYTVRADNLEDAQEIAQKHWRGYDEGDYYLYDDEN